MTPFMNAVPIGLLPLVITEDLLVMTTFVKELLRAAKGMGFPLGEPEEFPINEARTPVYVSELKKVHI